MLRVRLSADRADRSPAAERCVGARALRRGNELERAGWLVSDPIVTVVRNPFVRGWPAWELGDRAYPLLLGRALERDYRDDAHLLQYVSPIDRRLTSEAPAQGCVARMTCCVFDVDDAGAHREKRHSTDAWRQEQLDRLRSLAAAHPGAFAYFTRAGLRIVFVLAEPVFIRTRDDARRWTRSVLITIAYLSRRFGIDADPACRDWTRLFRLPHATRDPNAGPERLPTFGDVNAIGTLKIEATDEDRQRARELVPGAFYERTQEPIDLRVALERTQRYAASALKAEVDAVLEAGEGARNTRLNRAGFSMGQLVAAGLLPESLALGALIQAGQRAGLSAREALSATNSGFSAGIRQPRRIAS